MCICRKRHHYRETPFSSQTLIEVKPPTLDVDAVPAWDLFVILAFADTVI